MRRVRLRIVVIGLCFIISLLLVFLLSAQAEAGKHPFLIVHESDYQDLRDRANTFPWKEMKEEALSATQELTYSAQDDNGRSAGYKLQDIMGYSALAYILDPDNRSSYVNKIRNTLDVALADMQLEHDAAEDNWNTNVPFQAGVFNGIFALDIIYDELSQDERSRIEHAIDSLVHDFVDNWYVGKYSVAALWAIYKGDASELSRNRQEYYEHWSDVVTPDGVYMPGSGYGKERISSCSREHKSLGMDVLEFHGYNDYYSNDQFIKLHEWLYGYSHTPDFRAIAFGDSDPENYLLGSKFTQPNPASNCGVQPYRAYRFSDQAMRYATWQMQNDLRISAGNAATRPNGRLLTYVLMDDRPPNLADAEVPPSRVFPDGGAWFLEQSQSREALVGALWNVKQDASHAHKETNAIFLSGYGTHLLSNAGFRGYGRGVEPFSWDYIYRRAVSGNTGLIDYEFDQSQEGTPPEENDHQYKYGAGVTESLLAPTFDYARGDSGDALPNGKHFRNFHFVHPTDGKSGYWFVIDEFIGGSKVHLALHPYSREINTIVENEEYQAGTVDYGNQSLTDVALSVFLGTEPDYVTLHKGVIAGPNIEGQYLYPTYARHSAVEQVVTVLFPSDPEHPKPDFSRISGDRYTGARVDQRDGVVDYLLESNPETVQSMNNASFQVARSFFRVLNNQLKSFYAVGHSFVYTENGGVKGVQAEQDIAVYLRERAGKINSSAPQTVTFYYPKITGLTLNNLPVAIAQSAKGWIQVSVPQGPSDVQIEVDPT